MWLYFAEHFPHLTFQPSDPDAAALQSIPLWAHDAGVTNVLPPVMLDAASNDWPLTTADAIICINMIHIAPMECLRGTSCGALGITTFGLTTLSVRSLSTRGDRNSARQREGSTPR